MRCPHCFRTLRAHERTAAPGIVLRVHDCHACRLRFKTEERVVQEITLPPRVVPTPEQRKAERSQWHRDHPPALRFTVKP
jgi:transcriptional regulator NrdR family protein